MPFEQAAALLMTYGTSQHALQDRARLIAGETLLVLGAGGGVGLAAVELGKAMGARVIAAASSPEKLALAREHGADAGVQYIQGPLDKNAARALTESFKAACGAQGAHVIYDAIGGDYSEAALRAIAWTGRHLVVGFTAGIRSCRSICPCSKVARSSACSGASSPTAIRSCMLPTLPRSWRCIWMVKSIRR